MRLFQKGTRSSASSTVPWNRSPTQLQVVHAIAKVPELGALVDELFFEAHFYFDGIQFGWGALGADRRHTVDEALALMRTLRQRGIRSHFWI